MGALGGALCGVALLAAGGYAAMLAWTDNFHPVIVGEMYRSAQPSVPDIVHYAKAYGIRTIINLRGANVGKRWYDAEVAEAKALDIDHVDFRMSARQEMPQARAAQLIAIMATARKPILIHCSTGADRSGLAAALYVAAVGKLGEDAAEAQISLRYGHISLSLNSAYAMDATWETLEPWLGFPDS